MARISEGEAGGKNVLAFLDMLAYSEGTAGIGDDGYNVIVGSSKARPNLFASYASHPNKLVKLNPSLSSTAAGRYQLLYRWWLAYQRQLKLTDFGSVSQDRIAIQQIREQGAYRLIQTGQLADGVAKCANIWASLPGNNYGQRQHSLATLQVAYQGAGGTVAAQKMSMAITGM